MCLGLAQGYKKQTYNDMLNNRTVEQRAVQMAYTNKCDFCIRQNCEHPMPDGSDCYEGIKAYLEQEVK